MSDYSLDMSVESPKTFPLPIPFPKPTVAIITDLEDGEIGAIPIPPHCQTFISKKTKLMYGHVAMAWSHMPGRHHVWCTLAF